MQHGFLALAWSILWQGALFAGFYLLFAGSTQLPELIAAGLAGLVTAALAVRARAASPWQFGSPPWARFAALAWTLPRGMLRTGIALARTALLGGPAGRLRTEFTPTSPGAALARSIPPDSYVVEAGRDATLVHHLP